MEEPFLNFAEPQQRLHVIRSTVEPESQSGFGGRQPEGMEITARERFEDQHGVGVIHLCHGK